VGGCRLKKKDLNYFGKDLSKPPEPQRMVRAQISDSALKFIAPELLGEPGSIEQDDLQEQLVSASAWDVAVRYHEFKAKRSFRALAKQLRRLSAQAILERAQAVLGSVVHPLEQRSAPSTELPADAQQIDLDIEETIENFPGLLKNSKLPLTAQDIWMSYAIRRSQPVVLSVDTSLSMTGEKLALTAVALAVVLLQFPEDPIGIIAFENEAKIIKQPNERVSVQEMVERFLDVPAQGYTHLEEGLLASLKLVREGAGHGQGRSASTVLLTDGKYTAGRDPGYLGPKFPHLVVLKMGKEPASMELCRELARGGQGALREVGELESLPGIMYGVLKDLLRGRSLA